MAIHGRTVIISIGGVWGWGTKSATLTVSSNTIEIASADNGEWVEFIAGRKKWSVSCTYLFFIVPGIQDRALMVGQTVEIRIGAKNNYLKGKAIIETFEGDFPLGGLAKGSFKFKGVGPLTRGT